jgi:flagellin-like hook-associated protein FlgL
MTSFPVGFNRAPTLLTSQSSLARLHSTNLALYRLSDQLSTGLAINRPGDDAIKAATISLLDSRIERSEQRVSNFAYAADSLDTLDLALGEATDLLNEAKSLGLEQINTGSSPEERANQAVVVQSLIDSIYRVANRQSVVGHIFGGTRPGHAPIEQFGASYRFTAQRGGLQTDLGALRSIPVTLGASNIIGATSARVAGDVALDPELDRDTRLVDLNGARGLGVQLGAFIATFEDLPPIDIDISNADTVGNVIDRITSSIRQYEEEHETTILGPQGVSIEGTSIAIDVLAGELTFSDPLGGVTGQDLGLSTTPTSTFDPARSLSTSLSPRLAWNTPIDALQALANPLGSIRINNNGGTAIVDLSAAQTLDDVRSLIEGTNLGVRVEINDEGTAINVLSEVSGGREHAMSIEEIDGQTAQALGIRSLLPTTPLAAFNDGRGVRIIDAQLDPISGLYDQQRNVDFSITLGDGFEIPIDLRPDDILSVESIVDAINAQASAALTAASRPTTDFVASLHPTDNGIAFTQDDAIAADAITVSARNNSSAAADLGLLDASYDPDSGTLLGEDRATIRPDNVFTNLLDLRNALEANDLSGIQIATDKLDESLSTLVETRAFVAGYARRVSDETAREEDRQVLDQQMRSQLRDLDYAQAATRYAQLQTQLQAGLQVTAQLSQLSLLDFLG